MTGNVTKLSQKDYLKKYLSGGSDEKKKKKRKKSKTSELSVRTKIIDDDVDVSKLQPLDDSALDLYETNEDAPVIAGIVDERPVEVQARDQYQLSQRWKVLSNPDGDGISVSSASETVKSTSDITLSQGTKAVSNKKYREHDLSPLRRKHPGEVDASPPRRKSNVKDFSPPTNKYPEQNTSPARRKKTYDSDSSPPRTRYSHDNDSLPPQRKLSSRESPPRTKRKTYDSDTSPPRRRTGNNDLSPPRRKPLNKDLSPPRKRKVYDSDASPRRRLNDMHKGSSKKSQSSDLSPARKYRSLISPSKIKQEPDESPPRLPHSSKHHETDSSFSVRKAYRDNTPPSTERSGSFSSKRKMSSGNELRDFNKHPKKLDKTLDGKVAGLQNASGLKDELEQLRRRENEAFAKMDTSISGKGAAAIQRDRMTGMKRNLEMERAEQHAKEEIENKKKEKYDRWGKGLKQTEDQRERLSRDLQEMSKPLARYADDKDLESYLRHQDREGDPMLEYLRGKKKEDSSQKAKPEYQGSFPPNRYGIKPGYRWDGRDRSNGYEQKWFENLNARKAVEEEAYKWSTSDM